MDQEPAVILIVCFVLLLLFLLVRSFKIQHSHTNVLGRQAYETESVRSTSQYRWILGQQPGYEARKTRASSASCHRVIDNSPLVKGNTIDLHGCDLKYALVAVVRFLKEKVIEYKRSGYRKQCQFVGIITGRGLHSKNGVPVIKQHVENLLLGNDFKYIFANDGYIIVNLMNKRGSGQTNGAKQTEQHLTLDLNAPLKWPSLKKFELL